MSRSSSARPAAAVPFEEGHLRLDDGDRAGERLDADATERAQSPGVVGQPPVGQQGGRGVDPGAERPMGGDRRASPGPRTRQPWRPPFFDTTSLVGAADSPPPGTVTRRRDRVRRPGRSDRSSSTDVCRASHQRSSWRSTFHGARGSRKVAVPTCTASAPACSNSTASRPENTPPTPTMGRSGKGGPALPHGPHGHRVDRRARRARPRRRPSTGRPRLGVERQAEQGVDQGQALGPGLRARRRRSRRCRARWGSAWPSAAGRTPWPPAPRAGGRRRVGEHPGAVLDVGAAHVDLERHDAGPSAEAAARATQRRPGRSPRPSGPRC